MKKNQLNLLVALSLIAIAVSLRVLPHPANFAPIAAVAIFGGAVLPKRMAIWTPIIAMVVSDAIIGFHDLVAITWGCYALIALASNKWVNNGGLKAGLSVTMSGSLFFFVVTNFAVWAKSGMYAHTMAGLQQCYVMALPFLRNTMTSDMIYTGALFGLYAVATTLVTKSVLSNQQA